MTETIRTTCKFGACEPCCGIEVDVDDGVMVAVRGDKFHPVSEGYLCVKGHHLLEYQYDPDRLLHPLKRSSDGFHPVEWDTATTDIGQRLRKITDQHGPNSVATYWGNAADSANIVLALTTAGAFGSRNTFNVLSLEFTDRGAVASRVYGNEGLMAMPDADHSFHGLLLGTNPVATQGMALLQRRPGIRQDLRDIQRRGGSLTVVDPRSTETTAFADTHLAIRPGTDLYFLVACISHLFTRGLVDSEWLDANTDGVHLWEQIAAAVDLDSLSAICDLPRAEIEAEAERFANARAAFATTRVGVQTGPNTTLTEWAVTTLNTITGNIGRPGGMVFHGGATKPAQYLLDGLLRNNFSPSRIGNHSHIFGGLPATVLADDILSDDADRVRALIVFAGNPVISFPDTAKTEAALERLDLLVCFDIYHSDTATFADYVLPAATQFEKSSMHFMVDKYEPSRRFEWRPQVVEPTGEARPEWNVMQDICVAAEVPFLNNPEIHQEVEQHRADGTYYPERTMYERVLPDGIDLDEIIDSPGGLELAPNSNASLFDHVTTPDKRIHIQPLEFVEELRNVLRAGFDQPDDYPLRLISGQRNLRSFNTWTHNIASLTDKLDEPAATIHPDLAVAHGLNCGDLIYLRTAHGSITIAVNTNDSIRPDTVAVPQFWGHTYESGQMHARKRPGVNINRLHTTNGSDTFTAMPVLNGRPCRIDAVK